jgi:hypothetical protein
MIGFPNRRSAGAWAILVVAVCFWVSCGGGPLHRKYEFVSGRYWREKIGSAVLPLFAEHDTEYTAGYSEEAFDSLRLGATRHDVEEVLGAPFKRWEFAGDQLWSYSRAGRESGNYFERIVAFDSRGTLIEKYRAFYMD